VNQAILLQNGFADAFKVVQNSGDSPLINSLVSRDTRLNAGETASQMLRRLYASQLQQNSVAAVADSLGSRLQGGKSVPNLSTGNSFAFHPFPQYLGGVKVFESNDISTYHALETKVAKTFAKGVTAHFAYTFSKVPGHALLGPQQFYGLYELASVGGFHAFRYLQSQVELRRFGFRPAARDSVALSAGTAVGA
jgi:hypothetical protein